uniref:G_PROTEIN_RECEP_F1_2 domain-containing protein n=1 Tax=Caenorhabditis japonica TaxID=281687 RepID=A0A8R1DUG0_CAEJA
MLNKLPTNTYLLCLAAMSSIFLLSLLIFWIEEVAYIYFYDIFHDSLLRNSYYSCIFNTFLAHVCDFSSVWLIVLVGVERLFLLHRKVRGLTCEKARVQVFILLAFAMLINSWILFVADMDSEGQCDIKEEYVGMYKTMTVVETIICMALPSVVILICNVLVIVKLNEHVRQNPGSPAVSFNTADVVLTTQTSAPSHTLKSYTRISSRFSIDVEKAPKKKKKKGIRYTDIQLTRSLLVVTWAFIALNLPNYVYRISSILFGVSDQTEAMQKISLLAHVFLYTHHAFLFYLYIFYSPQMKRRLKPTAMKLLECYCFKPPGDYIDHT